MPSYLQLGISPRKEKIYVHQKTQRIKSSFIYQQPKARNNTKGQQLAIRQTECGIFIQWTVLQNKKEWITQAMTQMNAKEIVLSTKRPYKRLHVIPFI
jgi:hypothetical protein